MRSDERLHIHVKKLSQRSADFAKKNRDFY